jgi:CheY-like chemotaxis protein
MINRKILVVDDQKDGREGIANAILSSARQDDSKSLLEKLRPKLSGKNSDGGARFSLDQDIVYDVDTAASGKTACAMILKSIDNGIPYNLIFLDMRMFGWDGLKSMEEIFKIDKKVQVVLCTEFTDHTWEDISEKVGRRDNFLILKKPFEDMEVAQLALTLTEKYYAEASLRHSQKMETVGELSAGLAHDFNNIIASLQATLSSIEFSLNKYDGDTALKNELKSDIETMNDAIMEGAGMVQVLLSLSKRQELPLSPVDLNELMERVIKICARSLDKSVEVHYTPSAEKAMVMAMERCIINDHK